ncbi:MAG: P-type conjugative transfer ATPase TrbB [Desulfocapsaceae bacterium]|nr:P-type conjugative transfer ATPase TrbB [Desulfocapsaceae bacterium]
MATDKRLLASLEHNMGPVIMTALRDPDVVEIMLNPDGRVWIEKLGQDMQPAGVMDQSQSRLIISLVASGLETVVTTENPIVEGELPLDGSRFEGLMPPVVSSPSFTIRKKASRVFSLADYVNAGILPQECVPVLQAAIMKHKNILVVGGTGSGKTTLVNALILQLSELCPEDRLLILEDTMELQSKSQNTVFFRTSDFVNMQRLVKVTMRYRPTRIIVGEVRDGAALDLLKAWNTGHPGGIATVHANSAAEGLDRLEELVAEATSAAKQKLIGKAVGLSIFIERAPGGRRISEILEIKGYEPNNNQYKKEVIYHA